MITCCYKCEERHPLCHDHCEKYIAQKKAHDELRKKAHQEKELYNFIRYGIKVEHNGLRRHY